MKKYNTIEAIAMLEENPKLRFKTSLNNIMAKKEDGIVWEANSCGKEEIVELNHLVLANKWTLIQQPIPFLEAVQAYAEGKTIISETEGIGTEKYKMIRSDSSPMESVEGAGITACEILEGKWYIEEE
jgi:hypothetical protein